MKRLIAFWLILAATLAGCATPAGTPKEGPAKASEGDPDVTETESVAAKPETSGKPGTPSTEDRVSCDRALPGPGPAAHKEVLRILQQTRIWLNDGEEDKSRAELECAIQMEPENKQVSCLLKGITTDLSSAQAGDSTPYTVRPGETLGSIAQRFLGDSCEFYLLSRFNKLKFPKQLAVGQSIRLPGRINVSAPPLTPVPGTTITPTVAPSAVNKPAPVVAAPKVEAPPPVSATPPPPTSADIEKIYRAGLDAYRRQDLKTAIVYFDRVLALDANHNGARVYRQQAISMCAKSVVKC